MRITRDMIPVGRENAISRKDLTGMTGLSDREVRRQIAEMLRRIRMIQRGISVARKKLVRIQMRKRYGRGLAG